MRGELDVSEFNCYCSGDQCLMKRLEKKSSLRPIPRESVFPEDLIGRKSTFKTYSFVKYALKKTYFKGL